MSRSRSSSSPPIGLGQRARAARRTPRPARATCTGSSASTRASRVRARQESHSDHHPDLDPAGGECEQLRRPRGRRPQRPGCAVTTSRAWSSPGRVGGTGGSGMVASGNSRGTVQAVDAGHGPDDHEHPRLRDGRREGAGRRAERGVQRGEHGVQDRLPLVGGVVGELDPDAEPGTVRRGSTSSGARRVAGQRRARRAGRATRPAPGSLASDPSTVSSTRLHPPVPHQVGAGRPDAGVPAGEVLVVGHRHGPVERAYSQRRGGAGLLQGLGRRPVAGAATGLVTSRIPSGRRTRMLMLPRARRRRARRSRPGRSPSTFSTPVAGRAPCTPSPRTTRAAPSSSWRTA